MIIWDLKVMTFTHFFFIFLTVPLDTLCNKNQFHPDPAIN
jgi:hypothetical protein